MWLCLKENMFWCSTKNRRQYLKTKEEQCINVPPRYVNCHLCVKTAVSLYNANRTLFHKCSRIGPHFQKKLSHPWSRSHYGSLCSLIWFLSLSFILEILLDPQNLNILLISELWFNLQLSAFVSFSIFGMVPASACNFAIFLQRPHEYEWMLSKPYSPTMPSSLCKISGKWKYCRFHIFHNLCFVELL